MLAGQSVGIVVPAYNEEAQLAAMLQTIPDYIDRVIVVDDASRDNTARTADGIHDSRIRLCIHARNKGVGGAILTGYGALLDEGLDIAVVMAGDGQMDPADLPTLLEPLLAGDADLVKGNRFAHPDVWRTMPPLRIIGNLGLSWMTRQVAGYPDIIDSQCGYTAIRSSILMQMEFPTIYRRYGFPNDFLAHAHSVQARLAQVTVKPVYNGQHSGIHPVTAIPALLSVLVRAGVLRAWREGVKERFTSSRIP
jgi:glycosyltransferase involved in cell wall biosynthesis